MKLLKIKIEGVRNFKNSEFEFDFTPSQRVNEDEMSSDIFELSKNIQVNSNFIITGVNASGKSTSLKLIELVMSIIGKAKDMTTFDEQKTLFMNSIFKDNVTIKTFWFQKNTEEKLVDRLYLLESNLVKEEDDFYLFETNKIPFRFESEILKSISASKIKSKKTIFDIEHDYNSFSVDRDLVDRTIKEQINEETVGFEMMDFGLQKSKSMTSFLKPFSNVANALYVESIDTNRTPVFVENINFEENVEIIKLFDPSVESIIKTKITDGDRIRQSYSLKFYNQDEFQITNPKDFVYYLSTGTIQGLEILCKAREVLKNGGILLVDEIENHLNKSIIKTIIQLFLERRTNPNEAILIFSTHYGELLDLVNRRDSIYILSKDRNVINISKASEFKNLRNELKHSALLFGGHFGTGIEHQRLTNIQKLFSQRFTSNRGESSK